jgi:diguanylate cyclase (GGDEF)-like protein
MAFPLAKTGSIFACLLMILSVGLLAGALICTYESHTNTALILFSCITLFDACVLSLFVGLGYFFLPMVFVPLSLSFFTSHTELKQKIHLSIFIGIAAGIVAIICVLLPQRTQLPIYLRIILLVLNISLCTFCMVIISFAFYIKFTKSAEKILEYNKQLEQLAKTDALTSLWNRRAINEHLKSILSGKDRHHKDLSISILDIDFFKKVNDEYGHNMGDYVLKSLSYLLKEFMQDKGSVARWGGEEFLLVFENMTYEDAFQALDELRERISVQEFTYQDSTLHLTITAGIEEYVANRGLDATLSRADENLYKGKTTGRNKVVGSR